MDISTLAALSAQNNINGVGTLGSLGSLDSIGQASDVDGEDTYSFASALTDAIASVEETSQAVTEEAYKLATGQTDNLHDITIASTQANLAVQLFVQLRNKTVSAYQELMNLQI